MPKLASINECPKCHAHRISRNKKKCLACGQRLLYPGAWFFKHEDAFHWMGKKRGWVHVSILDRECNNLITEEELNQLRKCNRMRNCEQLEAVCRDIKKRHGGEYPIDWNEKVNNTGIIKDVRPL